MSVKNENVQVDSLDKEFNIAADFPLPDTNAWRKLAEESLKGGSYEKRLLTQTLEGIQLEPIYTAENIDGLELEQLPGGGEFARGTNLTGHVCSSWQLAQELAVTQPEELGRLAENAVKKGQNALFIPLHPAIRYADPDLEDTQGRSVWAHSLADFNAMFGDLNLKDIPVHIDAGVNGLELLAMMVARQQQKKQPIEALNGSFVSDPLSVLNETGHLPQNFSLLLDKAAVALNWAGSCCPDLRTVGVNGHFLREAGADALTELGAMLSMGTLYIDELVARGLPVERIALSMSFSSGIGPFFFMEVAKFRALRVLWSRIISAYGADPLAGRVWVRAQTSTYEWTRYDRHVNLLRGTTEAFSAIVGGVDALTVTPFSRPSGEEDDFARRISRNLQIILRDESHLDRVIDPAGGSYYVEWLTQQLIDKAWALFVEIDKAGGYLEELKAGRIQERIAQCRQARQKDLAKRNHLLVGINAYANVKEEAPGRVGGEDDFVSAKRLEAKRECRDGIELFRESRQTALNGLKNNTGDLVQLLSKGYIDGASLFNLHLSGVGEQPLRTEPFVSSRLAEPFEMLRDRTVSRLSSGDGPVSVLLLTMGPVSEHKARAEFSKSFMEIAGFDVIYPDPLASADLAIAEAKKVKPDIVVICSQDDRYPEWVPALAQPLKSALPGLSLVLAGYPKEQVEMLRQQGVDEFIFLGCDALKVLNDLFDKSEVK